MEPRTSGWTSRLAMTPRWRHDGTVRGIDMHRARGPFIDIQELKRYVLRHDHQHETAVLRAPMFSAS